MTLLTLPSYITLQLVAKDSANIENNFTIAFKYLKKHTKKRLKRLLLSADMPKLIAILRTNIVFVDGIILSNGSLTNTIDSDIISLLLRSTPYFAPIAVSFNSYLNANISNENNVYGNLVELGEYRANLDFSNKVKVKEEDLIAEYSEYITFTDDDVPEITKKPDLTLRDNYQILLNENRKVYDIFCACRFWTDEYDRLPLAAILKLSEDSKLDLKDSLNKITVMYNSYLNNKPSTN